MSDHQIQNFKNRKKQSSHSKKWIWKFYLSKWKNWWTYCLTLQNCIWTEQDFRVGFYISHSRSLEWWFIPFGNTKNSSNTSDSYRYCKFTSKFRISTLRLKLFSNTGRSAIHLQVRRILWSWRNTNSFINRFKPNRFHQIWRKHKKFGNNSNLKGRWRNIPHRSKTHWSKQQGFFSHIQNNNCMERSRRDKRRRASWQSRIKKWNNASIQRSL